ncbi:MAG: TrkA family potassium uptake protein [Chloroflexi bacterium]|nr:TrkA family potassium uptake protein [Chloroflexota bacterium]
MHIIIIGCGRVGARLASLLSRAGHSVVIIDRAPGAFRRLDRSFKGAKIVGVGFDRKVLLDAGIDRADALATVSSGDNTNFVVASIAVEDYHVPRVVARIADPLRAEMYSRLGITTISATLWASARIHDLIVSPDLHNVLTVGSADVQLYEFEVPVRLVGRTVSQLTLPAEVSVVAITRKGRGFIPVLGSSFEPYDRLLVAAQTGSIGKLRAMLGLPD